jgi:hypothetical protein
MSPGHKVLSVALVSAAVLAACSKPRAEPPQALDPLPTASAAAITPSPSAPPASPTASPSPSRKPSPKPSATLKRTVPPGGDIPPSPATPPINDGVPTSGAGTFAIAGGGTDVTGGGATLNPVSGHQVGGRLKDERRHDTANE